MMITVTFKVVILQQSIKQTFYNIFNTIDMDKKINQENNNINKGTLKKSMF